MLPEKGENLYSPGCVEGSFSELRAEGVADGLDAEDRTAALQVFLRPPSP